MARVEINELAWRVFSRAGSIRVASNASVYVYTRGTTTQVSVYAAESGGSPLAQPLTVDAQGRIEAWVAPGSYDLYVSHADGNYTQPYEAVDYALSPAGIDDRVAVLEEAPLNASTYVTLQAAFDAVPATGGRVYIPAGLYSERVSVTGQESLSVFGDGSSSVIQNDAAGESTMKFVNCDELDIEQLRPEGKGGTLDGLHLENCQRARAGSIFSRGSYRYGIYAQRCFGLTVDPSYVSVNSESPYPTGVANCISGLVLGWDGSAVDSGCNGFQINGGDYLVGQSDYQRQAVQIDHAEGGVINSPLAGISGGGILLATCENITSNGYYGEANPSDVEYATGTCSVTNGSTNVTGSGTAWNTNDGEGRKNALPGKYLIVGTKWARIASIQSDTQITLAEAWPGTTQAGVAYRMQGVDLHLKSTKNCQGLAGRGGGAVLLENSDNNVFSNLLTESIFFDADSANNAGRVTTNRATASSSRKVDNGTANLITQFNWQTGALVGGQAVLLDVATQRFVGLNQFTRGAFVDPAPGIAASIKANDNVAFDYAYGTEQPDPSAPPADLGVHYFRENGGKTEFVVRFATGAIQQIAIEP